MTVFGAIFLVTTLLILVFKKENNAGCFCTKVVQVEELEAPKHQKISVLSTYKMIWSIIQLIPVRKLTFILLTLKV